MKKILSTLYPLIFLVFVGLIWLIARLGAASFGHLHPPPSNFDTNISSWGIFLNNLGASLHHPLSLLLLQLLVILTVVRGFSYLARKIRQPTVIGEIIAGIVLGKSLLGYFFPEYSNFLFPASSLTVLKMLADLGLVLFMFTIGMELDIQILKTKAQTAILISHFSILIMHLVGMLTAFFIYAQFSGAKADFFTFGWFLGISMSITAFPVLARIIQERNLNKTAIGVITITCAAADDVTAWVILAVLITWVKAANIGSALYTGLFLLLYGTLMLKVVQPFLKRVGDVYASQEVISRPVVAMIFLMLFSSAYLTELMGIHALFGAFMAGVIMPQASTFKQVLTDKIEDLSAVVLLPLFFVFTGLRTQINLLNSWDLWLMSILIIGIASAGKIGGVFIVSRLLGQTWKDSLTLGVLMNTRGLMELIVLNIGYDLGILSPEIFSIMVLMALVTTFMTSPLLEFIDYIFGRFNNQSSPYPKGFNILMSFGQPQMGCSLLKIAHLLSPRINPNGQIAGLHLTPNPELSLEAARLYEEESFAPLQATAEELGITVVPMYKPTDKIPETIVETIRAAPYDMVLFGSAKSIFNPLATATSGIIQMVLSETTNAAAVLIDRGIEELTTIEKIIVLVVDEDETYLLDWAQRLHSAGAQVQVLDMTAKLAQKNAWVQKNPQVLRSGSVFVSKIIRDYQLVVVGFDYWEDNPNDYETWKHNSPSVLILRDKKS
jgi:Kef-type K+ transport system membrane component KefB